MNVPSTTDADILPYSIKLYWVGIDDTDTISNGRDPVIYYQV
jgi:hypothetical protein